MDKPDFSGYVTKHNLLCSDGVVILKEAFAGLVDGLKVPLVWQHDYSSISNILGHIILFNRPDGVWGDAYFNSTEQGQNGKRIIEHGDLFSLSIGARGIQKSGNNVTHGDIYEVSLVVKGANPGAKIEYAMAHSGVDGDDRAVIYTGLTFNNEEVHHSMHTIGDVLLHMDEDTSIVVEKFLIEGIDSLTEDEIDLLDTLSDDEIVAVAAIMETVDELEAEDDVEDDDSYDEVYEETDDVVVEEETPETPETIQQSITEENTLKHNAFDNTTPAQKESVLTHGDVNYIIKQGFEKRVSSLNTYMEDTLKHSGLEEEAVLMHGLKNIDVLFPASQSNKQINFYNPAGQAVEQMMGKFGVSPLSRIKTLFMDISEDEARARGYIKGNQKLDSIESLLYRETSPFTVLRRTRIDRDDIIDIAENGIDVVAYMKQVQQSKFREEVVRAAILGDGRENRLADGTRNPDKISEEHIRPIIKHEGLFVIKETAATWSTAVDTAVFAMAAYQGSGSPSLIINPLDLAKLKVLKDADGHYLYSGNGHAPSDNDIAAHFGATEVIKYVTMPQGQFLIGSLNDYVFGSTKNGEVANFEQFDIDFNQNIYLTEARLSGSILAPKSFIYITVTDADVRDDKTKFTVDGLKKHPNWSTDVAKDVKDKTPGGNYASKTSEPDPKG